MDIKMTIESIHRLIPFRRLIRLLIFLAVTLQLVIISYNHLTGFYQLEGIVDFLTRLIYGSFLSLIGSIVLAYPDLYLIDFLEKYYPWNKRLILRILIQIFFTSLIAIVVGVFVTMLSHFINNYTEPLNEVLVTNVLIVIVVNIVLMLTLEAWIFFAEKHFVQLKAEDLEKELSDIKFEVLKSQINPHFMFNSLNVLSSLINKDIKKAQIFIDEFSSVYRYVLETIDKKVVTVESELDFVRSYSYLQIIRYGENLKLKIDLPAAVLNNFIPPLSMQVVLENAVKHNSISEELPLNIKIYEDNGWLITENNINPRLSKPSSTGIGQKNLVRRYSIISDRVPVFKVGITTYTVRLPLIDNEYESSDNRR